MGRIGGTRISSEAKVIQLNDTSGVDKFEVKDADGFPLFQVDSTGNVKVRKTVSKI